MLHVLTHDILPVFAMLALGFVLGRIDRISKAEAAALNRVAFLVLQPALILPLVAGLDWGSFRLDALALYAGSEAVLFALVFGICRRVLRRERLESWLLAMAVIFVNTLLYIWPISLLIYGEAGVLPVRAIVAWDAAVVFPLFIISTDLLAGRSAGAPPALQRLEGNPVLLGIVAGLVLNLAGITLPAPVATAFDFAGHAAAPLTLLALGVILSGHALRLSRTIAVVSGMKLLAFPATLALGLWVIAPPAPWGDLTLLTAAGPSGAMAFALALLYGVRTDVIAPVIVWTSGLSLISLAYLA